MTIEEIGKQIAAEFELFDDWMDKYNYLIELGKGLPLIDEQKKKPENLIVGCQSKVWISAEYIDGTVLYHADSDAIITKGLVSLLLRAVNGHTPDEIMHADLSFLDNTGLKEHLSPTRSNGLVAMVKQVKFYAMAFKTRESN
ncbi:MAG: SufE family protein [Bacteroidales bacterium]|nr:SufE family protein [Bacteroidales bacterium]MDD3666092.1 SufE family protein [Bacteroidales bacterium]